MKIGIPSSEDKKMVADNFGRTYYFAIYDTDAKSFDFVDNTSNLNAVQGAGIQAASSIVNHKAEVVLSPRIGPKAYGVLEQAGIKMYLIPEANTSLELAIELFNNGKLEMMKGFVR